LTSFALYEAYGTRPYEWGDDPDRQKANTKEEETDLGLLNEGMRYRDLDTGTFTTRDPIGYGDGPNVYCYVHCNPIMSFDPWGLEIVLVNKGYLPEKAWAKAQADYHKAVAYLKTSEIAKKAIEKIEGSSAVIEITIASDYRDKFNENRENEETSKSPGPGGTIEWSASKGLGIVKDGKETGEYQSPAMGLLHEFGEVLTSMNGGLRQPENFGTIPQSEKDADEMANINGFETPVAKQLGEPVRDNHEGVDVIVESPTEFKSEESSPEEDL